MRAIEKSICTVCLDAPMPRVSEDIYKSRVAAQMLHGGGSRLNSGNRWFDKTLQVRTDALKVLKRWLWRCFLKSKNSQEPFAAKILMSREWKNKGDEEWWLTV